MTINHNITVFLDSTYNCSLFNSERKIGSQAGAIGKWEWKGTSIVHEKYWDFILHDDATTTKTSEQYGI
jgi:hypothetical protein